MEGQAKAGREGYSLELWTVHTPSSNDWLLESVDWLESIPLALRATLQMMLDGVSEQAALLSARGTILAANDAWQHLAATLGLLQLKLGGNYLAFNRDRAARGNPHSAAIVQALEDIAKGTRKRFQRSFPMPGQTNGMSFKLRIMRVSLADETHLLVTRQDITELKRLQRDQRRLGRRLEKVHAEERRRTVRDFHGSTDHLLGTLREGLQQLRARASDAGATDIISECDATLNLVEREVRTLSRTRDRPPASESSFENSLEELGDHFGLRTGIATNVIVDLLREPAAAIGQVVYRVVQEALTNIHRHAAATRVDVILTSNETNIALTVRDNGVGFTRDRPFGVGLDSMQERLDEIGGSLEISSLEDGTSLTAVIATKEAA